MSPLGVQTAVEPADDTEQPKRPRQTIETIRPGALAGFVKANGQGVARARISLKATVPLTVESLDDGAFRIEGVPGEPVFLAAAAGALASDVLGPFVIEPGKTIDGLVLDLYAHRHARWCRS